MKMTIIYPTWPKLEGQTEFHLPPHGPVVFAAQVPPEVPEPATMLLVGTGALGVFGYARRRMMK